MIDLRNIQRKNDIVTCDAYLENCKEALPLVFHMETKQFEEFAFPQGYEYCASHIAHARRNLIKLLESGEPLPSKKLIMWY